MGGEGKRGNRSLKGIEGGVVRETKVEESLISAGGGRDLEMPFRIGRWGCIGRSFTLKKSSEFFFMENLLSSAKNGREGPGGGG